MDSLPSRWWSAAETSTDPRSTGPEVSETAQTYILVVSDTQSEIQDTITSKLFLKIFNLRDFQRKK